MGEFKIHVNDTSDPSAEKLRDVLESFGLAQSVGVPTHRDGNVLDLVITGNGLIPPVVTVFPSDLISDHALVFSVFGDQSWSVNASESVRSYHCWEKVPLDKLRQLILDSPLCLGLDSLRDIHPDDFFNIYTSVFDNIAKAIVPLERTCLKKHHRAYWFDDDCFMARRGVRSFEKRH